MVVMGEKGIKQILGLLYRYLHIYNFSSSILYPMFLLSLFCYFHVEPLHSSLIYCSPFEILYSAVSMAYPPSLHFLASLCPFYIIPAILSFLFFSSIETAREKHSCVTGLNIQGLQLQPSPHYQQATLCGFLVYFIS